MISKNTHVYKGKHYSLLSRNVKIQVNGVWVPAISYTNTSGIQFVRTADEFDTKFKEIA